MCLCQAPVPLVKLSKSRKSRHHADTSAAEISRSSQSQTGRQPVQSVSVLTGHGQSQTGRRPGLSLTGSHSSQSVTGASGSHTLQSSTAPSEVIAIVCLSVCLSVCDRSQWLLHTAVIYCTIRGDCHCLSVRLSVCLLLEPAALTHCSHLLHHQR